MSTRKRRTSKSPAPRAKSPVRGASPASTRRRSNGGAAAPAPGSDDTLRGGLLQEQVESYKERGYGLVVAVLVNVGFFIVLPQWGKEAWPALQAAADSDWVAAMSGGRLHTPEKLYAVGGVGSLAAFNLYVFGMIVASLGTFWGGNLIMQAIYSAEHPFFERYKIQPGAWPWNGTAKQRADWSALMGRVVRTLLLNMFVLQPITIVLNYRTLARFDWLPYDSESVPEWTTVAWHIAVFMVIEDTLFYWSHRMLHHPAIYKHVHKKHHETKVTVGLASEYAHPFEFVVSNAVPFAAGPILFRAHVFLWLMWTLWRIGETVDGHMGYSFTWSPYRLLPFSGSAAVHDFHHSHNVGNFASFFTWNDALFGTDKAYRKYEAQRRAKAAERA